jgi:hypothetical protein
LANTNRPDLGPEFDPYTIVGETDDDSWRFTARLVASPTGLKVWALTITPEGLLADGPPPEDAPGLGINTGVLKMINFPKIREVITRQTNRYLARVLDELDSAVPEDRMLLKQELARAKSESSRSVPPKTLPPGRPAADDDQKAQWALDVLGHKEHHGYRQELRQLWNRREGGRIVERTVDTRMRRLRDDGWLEGVGKVSRPGERLTTWLENRTDPKQPEEQE